MNIESFEFIFCEFLTLLRGVCLKGFICRFVFENFLLVRSLLLEFLFSGFFFREFLREVLLREFFLREFLLRDFFLRDFFLRGFLFKVFFLREFVFVLRELFSERFGDEFFNGVKEFLFFSGVKLGLRDLKRILNKLFFNEKNNKI